MAQLEKRVLYAANVHTTGGRDSSPRRANGRLNTELWTPGIVGSGTNPEQLFTNGWSARRADPGHLRFKPGPWLSIVIAIIAVISIIGGELWLLRQTPPADSPGSFTVASDLNRALASVVETSLLVRSKD